MVQFGRRLFGGKRAAPETSDAAGNAPLDAWGLLSEAGPDLPRGLVPPASAFHASLPEPEGPPPDIVPPVHYIRPEPIPVVVPPEATAPPPLDPAKPVEVFRAADLPQVGAFADVLSRARDRDATDGAYVHAAAVPLSLVEGGMEVGRNLFGPGTCDASLREPAGLMRGVSTAALHDVVFSARAATVHSVARGLFEPSTQLVAPDGKLAPVARLEPFYRLEEDGRLRIDEGRAAVPTHDVLAVPVCGAGFNNYGHFLYDGLPAALQYRAALGDAPIRLVGGRLGEWQRSLLDMLGMLDLYQEVLEPARFTRMLATDLLSLHVPFPTRFVRPVFDALRLRMGGAVARGSRTVMLSRRADPGAALLTNRAEVEQALTAMGVQVVAADALTIPQRIAVAASARVVVGEAGTAMADIGYCDPGASVLEIQQQGAPHGWTRGACRMMGLRWHLFVAEPDMTPDSPAPPQGAYRIDVPALLDAVRTIQAAL